MAVPIAVVPSQVGSLTLQFNPSLPQDSLPTSALRQYPPLSVPSSHPPCSWSPLHQLPVAAVPGSRFRPSACCRSQSGQARLPRACLPRPARSPGRTSSRTKRPPDHPLRPLHRQVKAGALTGPVPAFSPADATQARSSQPASGDLGPGARDRGAAEMDARGRGLHRVRRARKQTRPAPSRTPTLAGPQLGPPPSPAPWPPRRHPEPEAREPWPRQQSSLALAEQAFPGHLRLRRHARPWAKHRSETAEALKARHAGSAVILTDRPDASENPRNHHPQSLSA